jgi:hypothetical protein
VAPITEVGNGMNATHSSCRRASHIRPPSKRLTCWKRTLCPTQKLAMTVKLVRKARTFGQDSRRLSRRSLCAVQIRGRPGQYELHGQQGQGYRVDAVAQEEKAV